MNNSFLVFMVGLVALIVFMCNQTTVKECFAGLTSNTFKVKALPQVRDKAGQFYTVPGTWQSSLSPRFSALNDYGAYIRYNMPSEDHLGVPKHPLTFSNMVKEEYGAARTSKAGNCNASLGAPKYMGGNTTNITNYAASNYNEVKDKLKYVETTDLLPVGDMATAGPDQPIIYDRFIYANQRSRLYGLGDPIRGDLPIVPCQADWFRPSVQPQIDLRDGAMMVMGGDSNQSARQTLKLMEASSGHTVSTFAGVNLNDLNMTTQKQLGVQAAGGDIQVTAFP
jgi:hypothetical protein